MNVSSSYERFLGIGTLNRWKRQFWPMKQLLWSPSSKTGYPPALVADQEVEVQVPKARHKL